MAVYLLNEKHVRERALRIAAERRPAQHFERVGEAFFVQAEAALLAWMIKHIESQPSVGVTIK